MYIIVLPVQKVNKVVWNKNRHYYTGWHKKSEPFIFIAHVFAGRSEATRLCRRPMSVCPSVTFVYCIHTDEDIVKLLSWPGSPILLVFWPRAPIPKSKANYFSVTQKYSGNLWRFLWPWVTLKGGTGWIKFSGTSP